MLNIWKDLKMLVMDPDLFEWLLPDSKLLE